LSYQHIWTAFLTRLVGITSSCKIQPLFGVWMFFNHKKSARYKLQDIEFCTSIRGLVDTKDGISVCNDPCFFKRFLEILDLGTCRFNLSGFRRGLDQNWAKTNVCTAKLIIVTVTIWYGGRTEIDPNTTRLQQVLSTCLSDAATSACRMPLWQVPPCLPPVKLRANRQFLYLLWRYHICIIVTTWLYYNIPCTGSPLVHNNHAFRRVAD
jgi:hypothetical protein